MPPGAPFVYASASGTSPGAVRSRNEDAMLERPDVGLWAVADGMGGHRAGDRASAMIVQALDRLHGPIGAPALLAQVRQRLEYVHRRLRSDREATGVSSGSTVVVLLAAGGHYCCLWAGDSRLYRLRDGRLTQVTRDHSHVQTLIDSGALSPEEARDHRMANIVTRAVGVGEDLALAKCNERLHPNDVFLLCSDGLTKAVGDAEIAAKLAQACMQCAVRDLLDLALDHRADDNVTAVAVRVRAAGGRASPANGRGRAVTTEAGA
jgi:serine/threonine protein phosphatase PrpC